MTGLFRDEVAAVLSEMGLFCNEILPDDKAGFDGINNLRQSLNSASATATLSGRPTSTHRDPL
jgi:hypothetical protein